MEPDCFANPSGQFFAKALISEVGQDLKDYGRCCGSSVRPVFRNNLSFHRTFKLAALLGLPFFDYICKTLHITKMKRFFVFVVLFLLPWGLTAQDNPQTVPSTWDKAFCLSGHSRARFELDLSKAVINGVEAEDFKATEPEWKTGVQDMILDFVKAFNAAAAEGVLPMRIGPTMEADRCFLLHVGDVTEGGACVEGMLDIRSADGELLFSRPVYARKGIFGTQLNLMGDALELMGGNLGKEISNRLRAPDSNLKEIKQAIKDLVKGGESTAISVSFPDALLKSLEERGYAKSADEAFVKDMEKQFFDAFRTTLSKSLGSVPEDKLFIAGENPGGAVMKVCFVTLANIRDETELFAEVFLEGQDGKMTYGILCNDELTSLKKIFCSLQMEKMGKKLGKIK